MHFRIFGANATLFMRRLTYPLRLNILSHGCQKSLLIIINLNFKATKDSKQRLKKFSLTWPFSWK